MYGTSDRTILVLGGTGHYGRHIVHSLLAKGAAVRVLSRNAARASSVLGREVEIMEGDVTLRESIVQALDGVRGVVISLSAMTPKLIRRLEAIERDAVLEVLAEAERTGVSRVVYISIYQIQQDLAEELGLDSAPIKVAVEDALAESDLNWTVLGAPPSMELFFTLIRGERLIAPGGGPPALPTISPVDVGEIAAQAVLRADLSGKRFRLAGPETLSFAQAARSISQVTGRIIRPQPIPLLPLRVVRALIWPLTPFSDTLLFAHTMIGYIRLLNEFPQDIAAQAAQAHELLRETFDYTPTTLEMEAKTRYTANPEVSR